MGLAQDAPPNPQHRVGKIGGRPSRHHDAPSSRVPCQQQHPTRGQQPNHPAASAPRTESRNPPGSPSEPTVGVSSYCSPLQTPPAAAPPAPRAGAAQPRAGASGWSAARWRGYQPGVQGPNHPAPRAVAAQPRAGASGWSRHRRRGATNRRCATRSTFRLCRRQRGRSPSGVSPASSGVHSGGAPARSPTGGGTPAAARPGPQTSAVPASGGTARTSR